MKGEKAMDITVDAFETRVDDLANDFFSKNVNTENISDKREKTYKYYAITGNLYSSSFLSDCEDELQKFGETFVFREWQAKTLISLAGAKKYKRRGSLGYIVS